jgi:hypothetical protein
MPEREYFSLRYAVPGFIFILVLVGMNFLPIMVFLQFMGATEIFGVILAFLSLFSGSAIGFVVAQVWFCYYHWRRPYAKLFKKQEPLVEHMFGLKQGVAGKDKDVRLSAILDFIVLNEKDKRYWEYFQRRWDLFHTLSSILVSVLLGLGAASFLRFFIELLFGIQQGFWMTLLNSLQGASLSLPSKIDLLIMIFTVASVAVVALLLRYLRKQAFNEYHFMLEAVIRADASRLKPMLHQAFPESFENTES